MTPASDESEEGDGGGLRFAGDCKGVVTWMGLEIRMVSFHFSSFFFLFIFAVQI